jgi:2-polyprenyl-6-methoxyphenol hydroxylase-like FAD-dependent oxidoreductase
MPTKIVTTGCCIAGGGPAGMMLGYLLARTGVEVMVLEKHADFFRDFRGDTIHPSTLEIMAELGLLEDLLKLPHPGGARARRSDRRGAGGACGLLASADPLPLHCADASMGFPQFSR